LVVHLRNGWGRDIVAQGESKTRRLGLEYYRKTVKQIILNTRAGAPAIENILIFTDAPESTLRYAPPKFQLSRWDKENMNGELTEIYGISDNEINSISSLPIKVIRGGNPLEAISTMAHCKFLILSKSSLGYLGALLNPCALVVYPQDFWHRKQSKWLISNYEMITSPSI
jgi:hypothetical protein